MKRLHGISDKNLLIIESILKKYPYQFYAFGSRVKGKQKKFSDLDLCFFETIPAKDLYNLKGEFEESNLSFIVDIVDWHECSESFQKKIKPDLLALGGSR